MCIAAFLWQAHPLYPLFLLQNRDEYHNRQAKYIYINFYEKYSHLIHFIHLFFFLILGFWKWRATKEVAWWEDGEILGGRDEVAGGTWLGCSRAGRVALLTNVLELHSLPEARTRGDLPLLFLQAIVLCTFFVLFCFDLMFRNAALSIGYLYRQKSSVI